MRGLQVVDLSTMLLTQTLQLSLMLLTDASEICIVRRIETAYFSVMLFTNA